MPMGRYQVDETGTQREVAMTDIIDFNKERKRKMMEEEFKTNSKVLRFPSKLHQRMSELEEKFDKLEKNIKDTDE